MDAMTYWRQFGIAHVHKICAAAGTTYDYWKLIAYGHKRPSVDLAHRLVEQSGGKLEFTQLLPPSTKLKKMVAARKKEAQRKNSVKKLRSTKRST